MKFHCFSDELSVTALSFFICAEEARIYSSKGSGGYSDLYGGQSLRPGGLDHRKRFHRAGCRRTLRRLEKHRTQGHHPAPAGLQPQPVPGGQGRPGKEQGGTAPAGRRGHTDEISGNIGMARSPAARRRSGPSFHLRCLAEFASADAKNSESFFAGTCASRKIPLAERTSSEQTPYHSLRPTGPKLIHFVAPPLQN